MSALEKLKELDATIARLSAVRDELKNREHRACYSSVETIQDKIECELYREELIKEIERTQIDLEKAVSEWTTHRETCAEELRPGIVLKVQAEIQKIYQSYSALEEEEEKAINEQPRLDSHGRLLGTYTWSSM